MTARDGDNREKSPPAHSTSPPSPGEPPFLSVVVPAYNEADRLPATIRAIVAYLADQPYPSELIVADDGSDDATVDVARRALDKRIPIRILELDHRGKAAAVRAGVLATTGRNVLFTDADLSSPIAGVERLLALRDMGHDVVIGSREGVNARRIREPAYRHLMGRAFNWFVRAIAVRGVRDTQCGFKLFSRAAVDDIFPRLLLHQSDASLRGPRVSAFDVEVLYIAHRRGFKIAEAPVIWTHVSGSKVRPGIDSIRMFMDVLQVRWNALRGKYN